MAPEFRTAAAGEGNHRPARWGGLRRLPSRARGAALVLLACSACPPAVLAGARWSPIAAWLAAHPGLVNLVALAAAFATVIAWDRPRSVSPGAYARQLRARFLELQSTFDADARRRPREGKEKEHDRVPSEP